MNTSEQPASESASSDKPAASGSEPDAPKKSRNPMEKIVVWGLILGLGVIAGHEAVTRFGHQKAFDTVDAAYRNSLSGAQHALQTEKGQSMLKERIESGMGEEQAEIAVLAEMRKEDPNLDQRLTITEAEAMLSGFPTKTVEELDDGTAKATYRWKTLLKDYGGIRLQYSRTTGEVERVTDFSPGE